MYLHCLRKEIEKSFWNLSISAPDRWSFRNGSFSLSVHPIGCILTVYKQFQYDISLGNSILLRYPFNVVSGVCAVVAVQQ
jgi:hypothetical protein